MLKTPTALAAVFVSCVACVPVAAQTLEACAVLPADTFEAGPTSGQFIAAANVVKHQVADLMHIDDPDNLGGLGQVFTM